MVRRMMTVLLAGQLVAAALSARAEDNHGECPIQSALKQLPQLEYQVAAKKTSCAKTAAELSKQKGVPLEYVVGQRAYKEQATAMLALARQTETLVKQFATPKPCKESGTIALAGKQLACPEKAAATARLLKTAIDAVQVSYKVGDTECDCPVEAKALAAKSKGSVVFCVSGNETSCPIEHRLNTARAKYHAAVEALAKNKT